MTWNPVYPDGSKSVLANESPGLQITQYIETTMGNVAADVSNLTSTKDHYWNVGGDFNGRHRYINSVKFTVAGVATDAVIGTGMDSVLYAKETSSRVEWFHRNAEGIYQFMPSFKSGTHVVTASYTNMILVPDNVYGEIFMWITSNGEHTGQTGFFKSITAIVDTWAYGLRNQGTPAAEFNLDFANGSSASGLNIRVKTNKASAGNTWNYRITYRTI